MANPLKDAGSAARIGAAFVNVGNEQVPTEIHAYCAWLNSREKRRGRWIATGDDGPGTVQFREESASDGWLDRRSLARDPSDGSTYVPHESEAA